MQSWKGQSFTIIHVGLIVHQTMLSCSRVGGPRKVYIHQCTKENYGISIFQTDSDYIYLEGSTGAAGRGRFELMFNTIGGFTAAGN